MVLGFSARTCGVINPHFPQHQYHSHPAYRVRTGCSLTVYRDWPTIKPTTSAQTSSQGQSLTGSLPARTLAVSLG